MQEDKDFIKLQSDLIVELRKQINQMAKEAEHMRMSYHANNNAHVTELNNKIVYLTDKIHAQEEKIVGLLEQIEEKDAEIKSLGEMIIQLRESEQYLAKQIGQQQKDLVSSRKYEEGLCAEILKLRASMQDAIKLLEQ